MKKVKYSLNSLSLLITLFCSFAAFAANASQQVFELGGHKINVSGELNGFTLDIKTESSAEGIDIAVVNLSHPVATMPPKLTFKWEFASHDMAGIWTPQIKQKRTLSPDWHKRPHLRSMLTLQAPVYTLFGSNDNNRFTASVSDAVNPVIMDAKVREEDALIYNRIELFSERHEKVKSVSVKIRFDQRKVAYYTALKDVADWWANMPAYKPAYVPDVAKQPMYSTWYSYHQNIDATSMLEEVKAAKEMGFKAIIVDDGWQTLDGNRGYAYTGDWQPDRLSNIKAFVDAVHAQGMKALLWYSVPFVGSKSKVYAKFKGKYLKDEKDTGASVLDPRYPEVRQFLIDHYVNAVKNWGWDGLKLDFIARFKTYPDTVLEAKDGRDYASVYKATDKLMTDIITQLTAINPEVAIEFRQYYIGPKMRTYGNMLRASDTPNVAMVNRKRIVDLRLLSGNTATHADMMMWHYDEPAEIAAFQFSSVLFSVPQVSVRLKDVPKAQFEMVKFYTDYWVKNRDVLLSEDFEAKSPLSNFPWVSAKHGNKKIIALYNEQVVTLNRSDTKLQIIDIVNAKNSERIVVDILDDFGDVHIETVDSQGRAHYQKNATLNQGVHVFEIPVSGIISIRKI